jgi:hypothetical protein
MKVSFYITLLSVVSLFACGNMQKPATEVLLGDTAEITEVEAVEQISTTSVTVRSTTGHYRGTPDYIGAVMANLGDREVFVILMPKVSAVDANGLSTIQSGDTIEIEIINENAEHIFDTGLGEPITARAISNETRPEVVFPLFSELPRITVSNVYDLSPGRYQLVVGYVWEYADLEVGGPSDKIDSFVSVLDKGLQINISLTENPWEIDVDNNEVVYRHDLIEIEIVSKVGEIEVPDGRQFRKVVEYEGKAIKNLSSDYVFEFE